VKQRGLKGVELFVSDKYLGLAENLAEFYPEPKWLRCVVYFYSAHDKLEERAVCCVVRDEGPMFMLEISDRFWPYQRHQPSGRSGPEAEFVQKVRGLLLAPACVQASFSAADEKLALGMYRRGVSIEQVTRAILLGCARKYVAMLNAGTRTPITSLQYFADIFEGVKESAIPESYWEPLRTKVTRMEQQWQKGSQVRP